MDNLSELKAMPIWVCWNKIERNGRMTKVPCSAHGGKTGTNEEYRGTWVRYDEAIAAAQKYMYSGVGFVLPEGWFFLDIDHKELDNPLVQEILSRFDTYAEYSQSGAGLHLYGKCDFAGLPTETIDGKRKLDHRYYTKNPGNDMELYIGGLTNRFAVFTGNAVEDRPCTDCTEAILLTLNQDMRREEKKPVSQKPLDKFSALYDRGDISGYHSHSEADAALCTMLANRVGDNAAEIDRLFRASALYRDKWERRDYREATIRMALESYRERKIALPNFIREGKNGTLIVSAPLLAKHVRENLHYIFVRDNGRQTMQIYVYDGGVYRLYAPEMLKGAIKRYIEDFNEELVKMSVVNEVYQLLTTDLNYIPMDALNTDESIINFENGLLDLSSGEPILTPHSPDVYSTIQIPCRWTGEAAPTPVFDMYMHTLTGGDEAVAKLLLEFMGACLSNVRGYRMKKSLFLVGPGNSGKSQLKALCERLLGRDNFTGIDLKEIEARFGTSSIYGMRLAGSSDMRYMTVSELNAFKLLTGGDCVFAEFKGEQQFKYTYCGLLWFCMNKLPHFGGDTGAWVYDRIMIVHCDNVIENSRQDKMLLEKMYAEREGIVYKCIDALMDVIRNGYRYSEPKCVLDARNTYMEDNSTVITFFHECMVPRKHKDNCTTGKLYDVYRAWCVDNNNGYAETARAFRDKLCEYLGSSYKELTVHTENGTCYRDYTLSFDAKRQYARVYGYDNLS